MGDYEITFEPIGRKGRCHDSETILDCARSLGIGISSICGGRGTCKTCKVQVTEGTLSKPTDDENIAFSREELEEGWRLACQTTPTSDCKIVIPPETLSASERIHLEGAEVAVSLELPVKAYNLKLKAPSLTDQQADADKLLSALKKQYRVRCNNVDINLLRTLSPQIRKLNWKCQVSVRNDEIIAVGPPSGRQLGLAVDLGTTTIAGYLIDLGNGQTLASLGAINPQVGYGEDIISRIDYVVKSPREGKKLQKLVVDKLNELAAGLCSKADADAKSIVEAVIVGNTAMHHLLLRLPVRQLVLAPFTAAVGLPLDIKAHELGLKLAPGSYVHFPPVITGFVGADHLAMLQAANPRKSDGVTIALDIGTNTEISLIKGEEIASTSCASGPAFEGGHIKHGMRAAKGAIERLRITDNDIQYQTIEDAPPIGICGSGVMDALAQLYLSGTINESGRFDLNNPRVRTTDDVTEFVLVDRKKSEKLSPIVITQKDIRELQLAKAAIRAGIQLLLEYNGFTEKDIGQVIIAGAFGSYIDLSSAVAIGLLPALPLDCFRQVGNAAGIGAKMSLISTTIREEARGIVSRSHYIELASTPEFKKVFVEASYLGKYRINHGKRDPVK
ncbi:ASKHA domain-containing protein [Chloroflexota bacterium]